MISLGYCALFSKPALRSLNCLRTSSGTGGSLVQSVQVVRGSRAHVSGGRDARIDDGRLCRRSSRRSRSRAYSPASDFLDPASWIGDGRAGRPSRRLPDDGVPWMQITGSDGEPMMGSRVIRADDLEQTEHETSPLTTEVETLPKYRKV